MDVMQEARTVALLGGVAAGLILAVIGAGLVLVAYFFRRRAAQGQGWPSTLGTVQAVTIRRLTGEQGGEYYAPDVTYQYQVGGQVYHNSRINFDPHYTPDFLTPETAQARFPLGRPLTVYYNPRNPGDAVLMRTEVSSTGFIIGAIAVFVLALVFPPLFVLAGIAAMGE